MNLTEKQTDSELAASLLRREIAGHRKFLIVICCFGDSPNVLLYNTSRDTRSMDLVDEDEALEKLSSYERLATRHQGVCEAHILSFPTKADFVTVAKPAIEETGKVRANTLYLLSVLDQLLTS